MAYKLANNLVDGVRVVADENFGDAILAFCFTWLYLPEKGQSQKYEDCRINHGEKTERQLCDVILNKESSG
jgi:hypothetical protein